MIKVIGLLNNASRTILLKTAVLLQYKVTVITLVVYRAERFSLYKTAISIYLNHVGGNMYEYKLFLFELIISKFHSILIGFSSFAHDIEDLLFSLLAFCFSTVVFSS